MYILVYDFGVSGNKCFKVDEISILEKVRNAPKFNNTVLLDQYAKKKW